MNTPAITVIIPTYQGAQRVLRTLDCLKIQSFTDFEAVVVIDGSRDNTYALLRSATWPFTIEIINQANQGRAGARNAGVGLARGEILVFLDDDVVFDDSLLERYHAAYRRGQDIVVGAEYPIATSENKEFFDYASYLNDKWSGGALQSGVLSSPYLNAGNMMMRKSVFMALGMFDARLRDAEDFDLAVKAFDKGMPIYFDQSIQAGHHLQKSFQVYVKRLVEYERARNALVAINPLAGKYIIARKNERRSKRYLYKAFSWPFVIKLIDRGAFKLLPKRMRFRIYDFLLTSYSRSSG